MFDCDFENTSLVSIKNHFLQKHGHEIVNHCCYCNIVFGHSGKSLNHAKIFHSIPTQFTQKENVDIEKRNGYEKTDTAFRRSLQTHHLKRIITSIHLLELLGKEKSRIQNLIREKTRDGPKQVQLTTELKLVKPRLNEGSQEANTIFTTTVTVFQFTFFGISDDDYYRLIEQLASALYTFASHGSGWILKEIKNLFEKLVSFSPIQDRSFIALPGNHRNCQSLINSHNIVDENCFSIPSLLHAIFTRMNL